MRDFSDYMDSFGESQDRRDHAADQAEALREEGRQEILKMIARSVDCAYERADEGDSRENNAVLFVAGLVGRLMLHERALSARLRGIIRPELRDEATKASQG